MRYLLTIGLVLALCGTGWGDEWGGTAVFQFADSMSVTYIRSGATYSPRNLGAATAIAVCPYLLASYADTANALIQPINDPRTPGATQDSAYLYVISNGYDPQGTGDTMIIVCHPLKVAYVEGVGNGATADTAGASWKYRLHTPGDTTRWQTYGGLGVNDREATAVDSFALHKNNSVLGTSHYFKIPGDKVDELFDYGVMVSVSRQVGCDQNASFCSDDNAAAAYRPYIVGWETPSAAAVSVGTATIGAGVTIGPPPE